jgi:signal transduction histidine kinase
MPFNIKYILNPYHIKVLQKYACLFLLLSLPFSCSGPTKNDAPALDYNKVIDSANKVFDAGNPLKAIQFLDSSTTKYKNLSLIQKFNYYLTNYNYFYHKKNDKKTTMLYADSMMNLFNTPEKRMTYMTQYGQAYFFKGDILFDENKYEEAYQYYYQGKTIAHKGLNDCTMGDYNYRMGMIMYKQEHYQLAANYFKISSKQTNTCEWSIRSFYRRQELLSNTGLSYNKINQQDSAMFYYKKAADYVNAYGKTFREKDLIDAALGVIYGNEANIFIGNKDYKSAEELLKKSININLKKGYDNRDAQLSELKLAHLYNEENKPDSLIQLLKVVHRQFDTIKNLDAEADWNLLMANYLLKKNNLLLAYHYLVTHDALKDSVAKASKKLKETDVFQQVDKLEKDYEVTQLQQNSRIQQYYLIAAVIFGIMLLLIIVLVVRNWRRSNKNIVVLGDLNKTINEKNEHLGKALNELNQSSQEKDRILRTVAHDLRNPIGGIVSLTNVMLDDDLSDEQKQLLNVVNITSNNALELINEILEATTDGVSGDLNKELVEINDLVKNSVEILSFKAAEKHQKIITELLDEPCEMLLSREKIWRVISNLISNAIKFSPENTTVKVKVTNLGESVKIAVADNGIGIPDHIKDKIFNMFTEAKRPGTAGEKSFGLGLSICKQIIESHGGKIWFEKNGKQGTIFNITLEKS